MPLIQHPDGNEGDETIQGGTGVDFLHANYRGDKTFYGNEGNDFISGREEDLHVAAYNGRYSNFEIKVTPTNDFFAKYITTVTDKTGVEGTDQVKLFVDELHFANKTLYWAGDRWSNHEVASEGGDATNLGNNGDVIAMRDGNDVVYGNGGADILNGGEGNDIMNGGAGDDYLDGFTGNNRMLGSDGNDTLHGEFGTDTISGGRDNDVIVFRSSEGTAYGMGEEGNDTINGVATEDGIVKLYGGTGEDSLQGSGRAYLNGGAGDDAFVVQDDTRGQVRVTDFTQGEDKVQFWYIDELHSFADVQANTTNTANGDALIHIDHLSVTLYGVAAEELTAADFSFFYV